MSKKIVLATGNKGKIKELKSLLTKHNIEVIPQTELKVTEAIEDGLSFVENAIIKARSACVQTGLPAIADDSGIEVDALNGAPGIYSARYAGEKANAQDNIKKLLVDLKDLADDKRGARFVCVIVYMRHAHDPSPIIAEGVWEGKILKVESGIKGFGYDPIFYSPEYDCSTAKISATDKNKISHRGKALVKLVAKLDHA